MKAYKEVAAQIHAFLASVVDRGEQSHFTPRLIFPGNKPRVPANDTHWTCLRTGLNAVERRELLAPVGIRIHYLWVIQPVAYTLHQLSYSDPDLI
jgi:hypothetical protein